LGVTFFGDRLKIFCMHHFSIRDIERLSGIKAHTLRMWEQRYGLCVCKRRESRHRYYDNDDLKHILRIAWLYRNGYRISHIAAFSPEEINHLAAQTFSNDEYEVLVNQLMDAGLEYNETQFETTLRSAMKSMGLEKTVERVIYPFFDKIGVLWLTGHVIPAQEHFCSFLIQKLIITAIDTLPRVTNSKARFLLFTPEEEMHDLPLLFTQYILKKQGIASVLLGKNCSMELVQYSCACLPVTHLYFHFITNFTNCGAEKYIGKLSTQFPNLQIVASGWALKDVDHPPENVHIIRSLKEMISFRLPG